MRLMIGNSSDLILKSQAIRNQVFVVEQGISLELDLDGLDERSFHAVIADDEALVGTARLTVVGDNHAVMARVAVMKEYRGSGSASRLINSLLAYAREIDVHSIEIHAHQYLRGYYQSFGFTFIKAVEVVGEHQLIEMRLSVPST